MNLTSIIGLLAGTGTTFSFAPQVYHIFRSSSADGLSPYMMAVHVSGAGLWIAYGLMRKDYIVVGFNGATLTMMSMIIFKYLQIKTRASFITTSDSSSTAKQDSPV
jgi:MtN3 and saliva related transmembrane protein